MNVGDINERLAAKAVAELNETDVLAMCVPHNADTLRAMAIAATYAPLIELAVELADEFDAIARLDAVLADLEGE